MKFRVFKISVAVAAIHSLAVLSRPTNVQASDTRDLSQPDRNACATLTDGRQLRQGDSQTYTSMDYGRVVGDIPGSAVNIRSGPDQRSPVIGAVNVGDSMSAWGEAIDFECRRWYKITIPDTNATGFIHGRYFHLTGLEGSANASTEPASIEPTSATSGVCYFFREETLDLIQPCTISAGYGASAHYTSLLWEDGIRTFITMNNDCPGETLDANGFCSYSVDDREAVVQAPDVFMNITTIENAATVSCYSVINTGNSICYRTN
ncbi:MAG: SH3 domain-containing protein [Cyanobacteria bacterium J06635_1]